MDESGADRRAAILEKFEGWLDEALAQEETLSGVDAELMAALGDDEEDAAGEDDPRDLYSLWSAVTALTQEVKLQGRSFSQLNDSLAGFGDLGRELESLHEGQRATLDALTSVRGELDQVGARESADAPEALDRKQLDLLIDLRDRLVIGRRTARSCLRDARATIEGSLILRWFGSGTASLLEATEALEKGYLLSLRRVDEALAAQDIAEIECEVGDPFDSKTMRAVDLTSSAELVEDAVAEVVRPGYRRGGAVIRSCEVIVVRSSES